jgi:hypothetical protein
MINRLRSAQNVQLVTLDLAGYCPENPHHLQMRARINPQLLAALVWCSPMHLDHDSFRALIAQDRYTARTVVLSICCCTPQKVLQQSNWEI